MTKVSDFIQLKRFSHFSQSYPTVLTRLYYYCTFFKSDLSSTKNKGITVLPNFDLKKKIILTEACNRFGSSQDSTNYFLIKKKTKLAEVFKQRKEYLKKTLVIHIISFLHHV